MITQKELEILASFFPKLDEKTSKDIEKNTGLSHEPVFRILKKLVKNKYLEQRKIGKTNIFRFIDKEEIYFIYTYFMTKRLKKIKDSHPLIYKRIKEFSESSNSEATILFGSYAKGTDTEHSDVDLLVVSNDKKSQKLSMEFKTKYNIKINPIIVKKLDFKNIKKDNPEFYNDLVEFGIIFSGLELFFKEVYK